MRNHWLDGLARNRGTYRKRAVKELGDEVHTDVALKSICNSNDMEDALIEALDAGLTAEEIADIQLGAIS
jgi:hypothetical protein